MIKIQLNDLLQVLHNFYASILKEYQYALITKYSVKGLRLKYHHVKKQNFKQLSKLINKPNISKYLQKHYQMESLNEVIKYVRKRHKDDVYIYKYYYQWLKTFAYKYNLKIITVNKNNSKSLYTLYDELYKRYSKLVSLAFSANLTKIEDPDKARDLHSEEHIYETKYNSYLNLEYLMISEAGLKLFKQAKTCPLLPLRLRYFGDNKFSKPLTLKGLCKYYKQYIECILKYVNQPQVMFNVCYHFYNDINSMYAKFTLHEYNAIKFNSVNAYDMPNFRIPSVRRRFQAKQFNLINLGKQAIRDEKDLINKNKWLIKLKRIPKIDTTSFPDDVSRYNMDAIWTSEDSLKEMKKNLKKYNSKAYQLYCHYYKILRIKNIKPLHKELNDYNETPTNRLKLVKDVINAENNIFETTGSFSRKNKMVKKLKMNWNNWNI